MGLQKNKPLLYIQTYRPDGAWMKKKSNIK